MLYPPTCEIKTAPAPYGYHQDNGYSREGNPHEAHPNVGGQSRRQDAGMFVPATAEVSALTEDSRQEISVPFSTPWNRRLKEVSPLVAHEQ